MTRIEAINERISVGQQLHQSEMAIGVGRRALRQMVMAEPIDPLAVEAQRAAIVEARESRNELRGQLAQLGMPELPRRPIDLGELTMASLRE